LERDEKCKFARLIHNFKLAPEVYIAAINLQFIAPGLRIRLYLQTHKNGFFLFVDFHQTFTIQAEFGCTLLNFNGLKPDRWLGIIVVIN
jgi:hypothetical protein